ncbi:hypothetical protein GCM10007377_14070 [Galliscardovia ingluviei]|uniref:DUF3566 domain-containing protein n=1 Tax=Galliscardovia ingluviei TaxID=1769422 RepID=A0A8J3ALT1_9BIFI|nr:hypothetical protein GCM10007377_14070 [Galliscardovia ingluviei]
MSEEQDNEQARSESISDSNEHAHQGRTVASGSASLNFDADAIAQHAQVHTPQQDEQSQESDAEQQEVHPNRVVRQTASQPQPVSFKPAGAEADAPHKGKGFDGSSRDKGKSEVPRARRMKLSVTHVDPWSVTKVSFLLSIALGVIQLVAVALVWVLLNSIGLFDNITQLVSTTGLDSGNMDIGSLFSLGTVLSATTIFSIVEIVLLTVLATIGAFLYNIVSALVGGVHVTLGDD